MALEVRIEGAATLHRVAAQIRAEGRKDLSSQMSRALIEATEPVKAAIKTSAAATMPSGGGYAGVFVKSLRFGTSRRNGGNSASLELKTYADGTSERRDIVALEGGRLRHPVFGRSRAGARKGERHANPWAVTSIRAGFHKRGTAEAMDEAQKALSEVINDYAARLAR
jgi:hypothetical protein